MYYVYVLLSEKNQRTYVGYTSNLKLRFEAHNAGESPYTSRHRPWKLVYYEAYASKTDAEDREKALKIHGNALVLLRKRIARSLKGDG